MWLEDGREARVPPLAEKVRSGCPLECGLGECVALDGVPGWARGIVGAWRACGGRSRICWPRAGGVDEQDAAVVFWFGVLDEVKEQSA